MTLEGGFTLQRSLPRRVAGGNTLVRGDLGWQVDEMEQPTIFFSFLHFLPHDIDVS